MNYKNNFYIVLGLFNFLMACNTSSNFTQLPAEKTNIFFNNTVPENDSLNILEYPNIFNGGGVGVADFNGDGLVDIYFVGNFVQDKLYINKGAFSFQDVSEEAGIGEKNHCGRGVAVVDINQDGWIDIYVTGTLLKNGKQRQNLLYINQGCEKGKTPNFKESSHEYGLDDTSHSTQAYFFDFDNDGDLDMYLVNNVITPTEYTNVYRPKLILGEHPNTDKLYKNESNGKHPYFKDVSKEAGIRIEGYGHAAGIADFNDDGWLDIYVCNDFLSNDVLYINQKNGSFKNALSQYFKQTSYNSMGTDVVDINNDGLLDLISLDMNPPDNYRKKMMLGPVNYLTYINNEKYGYEYQYIHNMLQLNMGKIPSTIDSLNHPIFADISYYSGIAETDWSWAPLVTDFDNDGHKDIIVTNGFPKDVTDHDFITYRNDVAKYAPNYMLLEQIPKVPLVNMAFKNMGKAVFKNTTKEWGFNVPSFSTGATYADLDNDGDEDIIINNTNELASIYKNNIREINPNASHFLKIKLVGTPFNLNGIGAKITLFTAKEQQTLVHIPSRGYLSSLEEPLFFGLGKIQTIDSIEVIWQDKKKQIVYNPSINTTSVVDYKNAKHSSTSPPPPISPLFKEITNISTIQYPLNASELNDFNIQRLLPHASSATNPPLAVGDFNEDGIEDFIVGGTVGYSAQIFLQNRMGAFIQKPVIPASMLLNKLSEDQGIAVFDANNDGHADLYIASGSMKYPENSPNYRDYLYLGDGKANFVVCENIPPIFTSKSCVRLIDFDKDGDDDIFLAGRISPGKYPKPVSSFLLTNTSKNNNTSFALPTLKINEVFKDIGIVNDALVTDFNQDSWTDIILVGEWMSPQFFKNDHGVFVNVSQQMNLEAEKGWWNSISAGDFNNDGRIDYILGNIGLNSYYRASVDHPMKIIQNDFDDNKTLDAIMGMYLPDKNNKYKLFPIPLKDEISEQIPALRKKFLFYKDYANTEFEDIFAKEKWNASYKKEAQNFHSIVLLQDPKGKFQVIPLPYIAQWSVIDGIVVEDFDNDGNLDCIVNTNDFSPEPNIGRYDGLNGLFLKGDGTGNFIPLSMEESGIFLPGDGKGLICLPNGDFSKLFIVSSANKGKLQVFEKSGNLQWSKPNKNSKFAIVHLKNGKKRRVDFYAKTSFMSQSTRNIILNNAIDSVINY